MRVASPALRQGIGAAYDFDLASCARSSTLGPYIVGDSPIAISPRRPAHVGRPVWSACRKRALPCRPVDRQPSPWTPGPCPAVVPSAVLAGDFRDDDYSPNSCRSAENCWGPLLMTLISGRRAAARSPERRSVVARGHLAAMHLSIAARDPSCDRRGPHGWPLNISLG